MSVQITLECDRIGCFAEFQSGPQRGFATLAETRADAKAAGWKRKTHPGSKRRFDYDFCPEHDSAVSPEQRERAVASRLEAAGQETAR